MTTCRMTIDRCYQRRFYVDGREVDERTYQRAVRIEQREVARKFPKQRGRRFAPPGLYGTDWTDWSKENGGRGRYCPQMGRKGGKRPGYFTSRAQLIEAAKRRGYAVDLDD